MGKKRGNLFVAEAGYATTYTGDEECEFGVLLGKSNEFIHVGTNVLDSAMHSGNGIALTLESDTLAHDGTKTLVGHAGGTSAMHALQVGPKHKDLIFFEVCDEFWSNHELEV